MAVLIASLLGGCSSRQPDAPRTAAERAAAIDARAPRLRLDTTTVFGLSAEGTHLAAAYDGAALRRLRAEYLGESGRASETFYFDSALFYVVRRDEGYDAPLSGRVVDSAMVRYDLAAAASRGAVADSLRALARELLAHFPRR